VLKTVALPIGFGFGFEAEGDLGKCIYRRTPVARANANVFGDDATPGERARWAWAECTEESVEEDQREQSARSSCCWHCCCPRSHSWTE
jgi:hypothetical protein